MKKPQKLILGIDIGSVSMKFAVLDCEGNIVKTWYQRMKGETVAAVSRLFGEVSDEFPVSQFERVAITGSGGKLISEILDIWFVNEVIAQSRATAVLHPDVRTIVEIGGEDSKLIFLGEESIADFAMNAVCAAGTGSFLDQQASRLGVSIEEEFGALALKSKKPPRIAGRCSVFAKSDMIHLQQEATPDYDIVAGLCYAMARNFKATLGRGKDFTVPVAFQGGVASNAGMVRAFKDILELGDEELVIPPHHLCTGAIGAALMAIADKEDKATALDGLGPLAQFLKRDVVAEKGPEPLSFFKERLHELTRSVSKSSKTNGGKVDAFLGIDVGSISTNVVAIDEDRNVLAKQYLMTAGRPIEAVRQGLEAVGDEIGDCINIIGVGTTGSGRYLIGDFVGADIVKNEITAQARAAAAIDSEVDTIFEIGGQDSKYISLENGVVVDFEMNKVCAAGTGSFLEEQAEKLGINIKEEFGQMALDAKNPVSLGERCTVFMESDIVHHKRRGASTDNLIAGLAYSIVSNYLNRVVGDRRIGKRIFFQGGVAFNHGVIAAFEKVTGQRITVPDHHEVTGALGVAIIAQEKMTWNKSRFKGFDLSKRNYTLEPFDCKDCPNLCEVRKVVVENEEPLYYGSRCEKYNVKKLRNARAGIPNLFKEREKILLNTYLPGSIDPKARTVGIPRALFFFEHYPFWSAFFGELGFRVVLSDRSNKSLIHKGAETVCAETCFPIKITHGHVLNLLEKNVDYLFLPSLINAGIRSDKSNKKVRNFNCPYVQTIPYMIKTALNLDPNDSRILSPIIDFSHGRSLMEKSMRKFGKSLGVSAERTARAISKAEDVQRDYHAKIQQRGEDILGRLQENDRAVVIISRPYNGCDSALNLDLPKKLSNIGFTAIPMDFLPVEKETDHPDWPNMYWRHGKRILRAADIIRKDQRLSSIFITNFGCGPDSFITHFYRRKMGGKPYLQLEVDEHSADAGAITRVEAFQDSLENARLEDHTVISAVDGAYAVPQKAKRTLYIPYMSDHSYALMAAFQHHKVNAQVLPEPDEETLYWGRKFTSGKECFPCIVTTGDMVKFVKQPDFDPSSTAFFMPSGEGPCRFGQYNVLQRMVLNDLGHSDVPIFAPVQDDDFYADLGMVGKGLARRIWQGIVAFDLIEKLLREIRPYEVNPGQTDQVYQQAVGAITEGIREDHLFKTLKNVRKLFDPIPVDRTHLRPVIGVVGEFFVRSSSFCNKNITLSIENAGGEAWFSPVTEWFLYLNYMVKRQKRLSKDYLDLVSLALTDAVQRQDEHKMYKIFKGILRNHHEPSISQILKLSQPYIDSSFEGEAILSIGKSVDFFHKGLSGIVNTMPFTCMPGTIVNAMLKRFREDHLQIPCLNMAYDGQEESNTMVRLEAFMYQAKQFLANHTPSTRAKSATAPLYASTIKNSPPKNPAQL